MGLPRCLIIGAAGQLGRQLVQVLGSDTMAPAKGACRFCDYQIVCGPYEELRTARKWTGHEQIERLRQLREAR